MTSSNEPSNLRLLANATAEGVLRTIYGDDYAGCTVRIETISSIVHDALAAQSAADRSLLDLYEKTSEAVAALSTPPANGRELAPAELQALLGNRLDAIRTLIEKVTSLSAQLELQRAEPIE